MKMVKSFYVMLFIFLLALVLYLLRRKEKSRLYMVIAAFGWMFGDFFLAQSFSAGLYIGGAFFALSHICLIVMFIKFFKQEKLKVLNPFFIVGVICTIITIVILEVLTFTIAEDPNRLLGYLTPIYFLMIGANMALNFSYCYHKRSTYYLFALGMFLFFVTDIWVFLNRLHISTVLKDYVWYFYPVAIVLMTLCNAPLSYQKKEK